MRIDCHVHAVGSGKDITNIESDIFYKPEDNPQWFVRMLQQLVESRLVEAGADTDGDRRVSTEEYFAFLADLLRSSEEVDAVVLLGMDAVFDAGTGELDARRTDLWVSNSFLSRQIRTMNDALRAAGSEKRFFFGASVSPNRVDWRDELDYVTADTDAVLLKIIPSAQHIELADPRHRPFWQKLAEAGLPLLCHVGPEYSFAEGRRCWELDDFRGLREALDCGVTVIAAHCATPVFALFDRDDYDDFVAFMTRINAGGTTRLYADTSALTLSTRIPYLKKIREQIPAEWLLHGTDLPIPIDGWAHLPLLTPDISPGEYLDFVRTDNPLDRDVRIKRAMGLKDSILTNAEQVLRLSTP